MDRVFDKETYERLNNHGQLSSDFSNIEYIVRSVNDVIIAIYNDKYLKKSITKFGKELEFAQVSKETSSIEGYHSMKFLRDGTLVALISEPLGSSGGRQDRPFEVKIDNKGIAYYMKPEPIDSKEQKEVKHNLAESMVYKDRELIKKQTEDIESVVMNSTYILISLRQGMRRILTNRSGTRFHDPKINLSTGL